MQKEREIYSNYFLWILCSICILKLKQEKTLNWIAPKLKYTSQVSMQELDFDWLVFIAAMYKYTCYSRPI